MIKQDFDRAIYAIFWANWRRGTQLDHDLRLISFDLFEPFQCMFKDRQVCGPILGKLRGAKKRGLCSKLPCRASNLFIIRRDNNAIHGMRLQPSCNSPGDQRIPRKPADILARDSLGTTARRNESENFSHNYFLSVLGLLALGAMSPLLR